MYGLPASQLNKVQRVLNTAARFVGCAPRFSHITPLMYELRWLSSKQRIHFKIFAFKASIAPTYIQNLISLKSQGAYNLRFISSGGILLTSSTFRIKVTLGVGSFQVAAPKFIWNALPRELHDIHNMHTFKSNCKVARLDFSGGYIPSLSINYVGMSKDMRKSLPQRTVLFKDENFI